MASVRFPTEFIRNAGLLLEKMVEPKPPGDRARVAAHGAVEGVSEEILASVPELHPGDVGQLVVNLVAVLDHLLGEAAQHLQAGESGYLAQRLAEGAARGLVGELKAATPELRQRALRLFDDLHAQLEALVRERQSESEPNEKGYRARVMGEGAVRGAAGELKRQLPDVGQALRGLAPAGREVVSQLVEQAASTLSGNAGELVAGLELISETATRKAVQGLFAEVDEQARRANAGETSGAAAALAEQLSGKFAAAMVRGAIGALDEAVCVRRLGPRLRETMVESSRAAVDGALVSLKQQLRRPLLWSAGLGLALGGMVLLVRRA
jgi:hypothetical protein